MSSDLLCESLHYISQYSLYKTIALGGENLFHSCFFMCLCIWYCKSMQKLIARKKLIKNMFQL